jgi:hypothetical protein
LQERQQAVIVHITSIKIRYCKITNWAAVQSLATQYWNAPVNSDGYNTYDLQYLTYVSNYIKANPGASTGDASAYALMSMLNGDINLYAASKGSTEYAPVTFRNGEVVFIQCP